MDLITLALAQAFAQATPGTAAAYAAAAQESAEAAAASAAAVSPSNTEDVAYILGGVAPVEVVNPEVVTVSGSTVAITGELNKRYVCGTVTSISITPVQNGITDVIFGSGATPAALTVPNTVIFPAWFDATSLSANAVYEISIQDGAYAAVAYWGVGA